MPFMCMRNIDIEQPVFGANFIKGEVRAEQGGRWDGTAKFKLWFNNGGAIEFGQCLLNAGRLASQVRAAQQFVATQMQSVYGGNIYPAPPPAYTTLNANSYGWVPLERFPDRPQANDVFMYIRDCYFINRRFFSVLDYELNPPKIYKCKCLKSKTFI